jgi:hypothetical protein
VLVLWYWPMLGRMARVDRASGARGPLTLRLAGRPERWIEEKQQTTEKLSYVTVVLVGSNRQTKSPVGLQKGSILPKMGLRKCKLLDHDVR